MGLVKAVVAAGAAAAVGLIATKRCALVNAVAGAVRGLLPHDEEAAILSAPSRVVKLPGPRNPRAVRRHARRAARHT